MPGGMEDYAPENTQRLRERAGLNHQAVAIRCEVSKGTARAWETGDRTPSEHKGVLLARALGVHPSDLTHTPRHLPTLRQLRQWRGLRGRDVSEKTGIPLQTIYLAETYTSPLSDRVRHALADTYNVTTTDIDAAWQRGRQQASGT